MSIGKWLMRVGGIGIALIALAGLLGILDGRTIFNILVIGLVVTVIGQVLIYVDRRNSI
jgi:hypothetical protein